tara:strand:+ start:377 stop:733 length:357 start_codon:yes stop_codon:yes gene_type:complete
MNLTDNVFSKTASLAHTNTDGFSTKFLNKSPSYLRTIKAQGRELNHQNLATLLNRVTEQAEYHSKSAQRIPQLRGFAAEWKDWERELASIFSTNLIEELELNDVAKQLVRKQFIKKLI